MLSRLSINNLAVVEDLEVSFLNGMNVITGETGSGKSLLIVALRLLLGERSEKNIIRTGESNCSISAEFNFKNYIVIDEILSNFGLNKSDSGYVIIRRVISESTNRNLINDEPVTLQVLKKIGEVIVDMHGPYNHQSLLHSNKQLEILDMYGDLQSLLKEYRNIYYEYKDLLNKLDKLQNKSADSSDYQIDLINHQIKEVENANLSTEEEEEVKKEHTLASNSQNIIILSNQITNILNDGEVCVYDGLVNAQQALNKLEKLVPDADKWSGDIDNAVTLILDTIKAIEKNIGSLDISSERLNWLDSRLATYQSLRRKYNLSIEEILIKKEEWILQVNDLKIRDKRIEEIKYEKDELLKKVLDTALKLREKREFVADNLSESITRELSEIGFKHSFFDVTMKSIEPNDNGIDSIEFGFAPNAGEDMRPLHSIASSGEISRVMLAVKTVLAKQDQVPVLVFDEIDSNIGGEIGKTVGKKLSNISSNHQLICITHLPQVAAYGTNHIAVKKEVYQGRTFTKVSVLNKNQRADELSRMLGGDDKDLISIEHAKLMLNKNN
ncbi:MAG: DNA repair protein RecN [Pontiellaceae bacterium]